MKRTDTFLAPAEDKALVRFMSPKSVGYLFDSEKLIAFMVPNSQFDYLAEPGRHVFMASMENKAFLEADLEAGRIYYAFLRVYMGVWRSRVAFIAVNEESEYWNKVGEYEGKLMKLLPDTEAINEWERANQHKAEAVMSQYSDAFKEQYDWQKLNAEDGR